jgi:hypothetical protein
MIKFYPFCEAFDSKFDATFSFEPHSRKQVELRIDSLREHPHKVTMTRIIFALLILLCITQTLAQSYNYSVFSNKLKSGPITSYKDSVYWDSSDRIYVFNNTSRKFAYKLYGSTLGEPVAIRKMKNGKCMSFYNYRNFCPLNYVGYQLDIWGSFDVVFGTTNYDGYFAQQSDKESVNMLDGVDSSIIVYTTNEKIDVKKTGYIASTAQLQGTNFRAIKWDGVLGLLGINDSTDLVWCDDVHAVVYTQQTLSEKITSGVAASNNSIFLIQNGRVKKYNSNFNYQGVLNTPSNFTITTIDMKKDVLYLAGNQSDYPFLIVADTALNILSQQISTTKYLYPSHVEGLSGKQAAVALEGRNGNSNYPIFANLTVSDTSGKFSYKNDASLQGININANYKLYDIINYPYKTIVIAGLIEVSVKNENVDTIHSLTIVYEGVNSNCNLNFSSLGNSPLQFHQYDSITIPSNQTKVLQLKFSQTYTVSKSTVFDPYSNVNMEPFCITLINPNNTTDAEPDNSFSCFQNYTVSYGVGIMEEQTEKLVLNLFPNPTEKSVNIDLGGSNFNWVISDLSGRELRTGKNAALLDISDLQAGIYIVEASLESGATLQKKLVIR